MSEGTAVVEIGTMSGESKRLAQHTKKLTETLDTKRSEFERALAGRIDPDLFIQIVAGSFMADPDLMDCSHLSIYVAAMEAAQIGLKIDGEEAALVGWYNKAANEKQAQLMTMFQGYVRLMVRAGAKKVWAHVVRTGDYFDYGLGLKPYLEHKPAPSADRGDVTEAYACVLLANGESQFEVMDREELDKIRAVSKASNSPAWRNWPEEMMRKAPLRRLRKYIELDAAASAAFRHDDSIASGHPEPMETFYPEADTRSLPERAESAAQVTQGKLAASIAGIEASGDALDREVMFGDHKGTTWRELMSGSKGYGYVKHFVLEECDHESLTSKLWEALHAEVERIGADRDEEHEKIVEEAYEKAMKKLSNMHGKKLSSEASDGYAKRLDECKAEGDFEGLVGIDGELKGLEE